MARLILTGLAVSSGIALGRAVLTDHSPAVIRHDLIDSAEIKSEIARLRAAFDRTAAEYDEARLTSRQNGDVAILASHILICRDPKLAEASERRIRDQKMNAEWALEETVTAIARTFSRLASPYIRERIQDVRLVADRVHSHLTRPEAPPSPPASFRGIFLARDIGPADLHALIPRRIQALVTEQGSNTAHIAILARSLHLPAVVGVRGLLANVRDKERLLVDALEGSVLVAPSRAEQAAYAGKKALFAAYAKRIRRDARQPACTEDGQGVTLSANVDTAAEIPALLAAGGEGIGLVRTEFSFLGKDTLPSEEELCEEYSRMTAAMAPRRVTFRTLDVEAGKPFAGIDLPPETNPALGLRSIRLSLLHPAIFLRQVRAIFRAGIHGQAAIMLPLISGLSEIRKAKELLQQALRELEAAKIPCDPGIPVGIMIELPSAVLIADILAKEVDFFSIGTNDLIQYCLGVDRSNSQMAYMQQPLHPAIIRAVKQAADMGRKAGIPVSLCGEMGSNPYCLPLLLGMGVNEISVSTQALAGIKSLIRRSNAAECRTLLQNALYAPTSRAVANMVREFILARFAEDIPFFITQPEISG
ncbi:MAG: phosphoenolpyruvate--protein phosphotransferase [Desulfovibrio sp.]|jgi:phosphotransferase system enzyme I (PtsI)|nr:phosphoenolpyruvate--protein phosphotransferase [Desulfovibrio sp.]